MQQIIVCQSRCRCWGLSVLWIVSLNSAISTSTPPKMGLSWTFCVFRNLENHFRCTPPKTKTTATTNKQTNKTKQKQNKQKQNKQTKQNKTKQNKTKQNKAHCTTGILCHEREATFFKFLDKSCLESELSWRADSSIALITAWFNSRKVTLYAYLEGRGKMDRFHLFVPCT